MHQLQATGLRLLISNLPTVVDHQLRMAGMPKAVLQAADEDLIPMRTATLTAAAAHTEGAVMVAKERVLVRDNGETANTSQAHKT